MANTNRKTVVVAGASGEMGCVIAHALCREGHAVRALVRNMKWATRLQELGLLPREAVLFQGDMLLDDTLEACLSGADTVVCCAGSRRFSDLSYVLGLITRSKPEPHTDQGAYWCEYKGVESLAQNAKKHNVQHFILISSITVLRACHPMALLMNCFMAMRLKWKLRGEQALRSSGIDYTILRPGSLRRHESGAVVRLDQGDQMTGVISRDSVAMVVAECVTHPNARNTTLECCWDDELTRANIRAGSSSMSGLPHRYAPVPSSVDGSVSGASAASAVDGDDESDSDTSLMQQRSAYQHMVDQLAHLSADKGDLVDPVPSNTCAVATLNALCLVGLLGLLLVLFG